MSAATIGYKNAAVALVMANALAVLLIALTAIERPPPPNPADQPPIIVLTEAAGFTFATGSAEIPDRFARSLTEVIIPQIADIAGLYGCDVIEVIGHTDGQRVQSDSNLDSELMSVIGGRPATLVPGSNVDLGLLRAWAVARVLRSSPRLNGLSVAVYSAGQMLAPDGSYAQAGDFSSVPERRRIEIRVRRSPGSPPPAAETRSD